jgi:hypothetical protein
MKTDVFLAAMLAASLSTIAPFGSATEWPQYRGPNQDGISTESTKLDWGAGGPKVVWKVPMNLGLSSFSISGGKAFTQVAPAKATARDPPRPSATGWSIY